MTLEDHQRACEKDTLNSCPTLLNETRRFGALLESLMQARAWELRVQAVKTHLACCEIQEGPRCGSSRHLSNTGLPVRHCPQVQPYTPQWQWSPRQPRCLCAHCPSVDHTSDQVPGGRKAGTENKPIWSDSKHA